MKIVYGSPDCYRCEELKKKLEGMNEKFKYVNIRLLTRDEIEAIVEKAGTRSLPIVLEE